MFRFGKNWQAYSLEALNDDRLAAAEESLRELLGTDRLAGATMLDVGCGSGAFSIAAARLGASVTGVDVDPLCVKVSTANAATFGEAVPPQRLAFAQASVLDVARMQALGTFDVVYAWGSLHHTGAMYDAIQNASERVAPRGLFVLSIYNAHVTSPVWRGIKWLYNRVPGIVQRMMALSLGGVMAVAKWLVTRRNPFEKERGMDFWFDVVDWVGGYPYEYATKDEVIDAVSRQGFVLEKVVDPSVPTGCNEFVFRRSTR